MRKALDVETGLEERLNVCQLVRGNHDVEIKAYDRVHVRVQCLTVNEAEPHLVSSQELEELFQ